MAVTGSHARTMPRLVASAASQFGDKVAIRQQGRVITYRELNELGRQAAAAFMAAGIAKGDRAAIWAPNLYQWIIAAIGLEVAGGVLVPLNTRMKGSEAAYILNRSGAKLLLTVPEFHAGGSNVIRYLDLIEGETLETVQQKICLSGEGPGAITWEQFLASGAGISPEQVSARADSVEPSDVMDMLFTSGTTGKPKGVVCAHGQNIQVFEVWCDTVGLTSADKYMIINPFFHTFGYKAGWMAALIKGAEILPVLTFDLNAVLQQIATDKVTMLPGPPTIYQSILVHPERDKYDLSSLRLAVTGAAAVPVELVKKMRSELNFQSVVTAYGLTESCGVVTICRPDDAPETIATTSGRAIPGVEVKCVDGEGNEVARGEPGEIWFRGYNVMQGYFDSPEATAETITTDGWLKTGDVGVMDDKGYIRITDRIKDMFITGGFNVYPAEIENALSGIPGVAQVAVIGIPDERMGEVGKAYIVRAPGAELTEAEVLAWCKQNIANYKVPKAVQFLEAMPLNASGKILKTELRKL